MFNKYLLVKGLAEAWVSHTRIHLHPKPLSWRRKVLRTGIFSGGKAKDAEPLQECRWSPPSRPPAPIKESRWFLFFLPIYFFLCLATLLDLWDLSSLTRDRTHTHCLGRWSLNHWAARKVPPILMKYFKPMERHKKSYNQYILFPTTKFKK